MIASAAKQMQIICGALAFGCLTMMVIGLAFRTMGKPDAQPVVAFVGILMAVSMLIASAVLPKVMTDGAVKQIDREQFQRQSDDARAESLLPAYRMSRTVRWALLEGAAIFNVIAYMLNGHLWSLGIAAALIVSILMSFPTQTRVEHWLEEQTQALQT